MVQAGMAALVSVLGAAGSPAEPLTVEYHAYDGCPDVNAYWKGVVARSSRIRRASLGEPAIRARIDIRRLASKAGDRAVATFTLRDDPRTLSADTCSELVDAIALMTVLALDPQALQPGPPAEKSEPPPAPPPPSPPSPSPAPPAPEAATEEEQAPPPPRKAAEDPPWSFAAVGGGQLFELSSGGANGGFFALAIGHRAWTARLAVAYANGDLIKTEQLGEAAVAVETRLRFDTLRADGCPVSWGELFRLALCTGVSAGYLNARISNAISSKPEQHPWLAGHLFPRIEFVLAPWLRLEGEFGLTFPVLRETFVAPPGIAVYRPPTVMLSSQLGLQVRFL